MTVNYTVLLEIFVTGAWVNISQDIRASVAPVEIIRDIGGNEVTDRVQNPGTLTFALDNSIDNSAGIQGYYSPDNVNCRTGFDDGTLVHLITNYTGTNNYKFYGRITDITVLPGRVKDQYVSVQAVDFMEQTLIHNCQLIPTQINKTTADLLPILFANLPFGPTSGSYAAGTDTFVYALNDIQDENTPVMNAIQRLCQSDMSYAYMNGDNNSGDKFLWLNRYSLMLTSSIATFPDTSTTDVQIERTESKIWNTVKGTGHPAQVGSTNEVLWTGRNEINIIAGQTVTFTAPYTDPTALSSRVGLVDGTGLMVIGTDINMSSSSGDGGSNLNSYISISGTFGGNSASLAITNNHPYLTGFVGGKELLQIRGHIIRLYDPIIIVATDAASKSKYGDKTLTFDMTYQVNYNVVSDITNAILALTKDTHTRPSSVKFIANVSDYLMASAMNCDICKRITLSETVSGLNKDYVALGYKLTFTQGQILCELSNLIEASTAQMWVLGDAILGVLGVTTILGY